MSRWNAKTSTLFLLGGVVFLMLLIVVLPDVDLPDTAFHRGTAPIAVHAQATSAPPPVIVASTIQLHSGGQLGLFVLQSNELAPLPHPNFRPILLRSIRC
jgi:hypothetical protein